jgi:hypothetical protein
MLTVCDPVSAEEANEADDNCSREAPPAGGGNRSSSAPFLEAGVAASLPPGSVRILPSGES